MMNWREIVRGQLWPSGGKMMISGMFEEKPPNITDVAPEGRKKHL